MFTANLSFFSRLHDDGYVPWRVCSSSGVSGIIALDCLSIGDTLKKPIQTMLGTTRRRAWALSREIRHLAWISRDATMKFRASFAFTTF